MYSTVPSSPPPLLKAAAPFPTWLYTCAHHHSQAHHGSGTHYYGCWQARGRVWAGGICRPDSPLALRRRGRKDFVVRTVPQRFTSATSLYVSMLVNSTSPNVEMPALLTRPHIPGQGRTQPVTLWAQIPTTSLSTVISSSDFQPLTQDSQETARPHILADTMSLRWNIQASWHCFLNPSVLSPS